MKKFFCLLGVLGIFGVGTLFSSAVAEATSGVEHDVSTDVEVVQEESSIPNSEVDWERVTIDILAAAGEKFISTYGSFDSMSKEESDAIVLDFIREELDRPTTRGAINFPEKIANKWNSLTKKEKELVLANPGEAAQVGICTSTATTQVKWSFSDGTSDGGNGNAFKHTFWNMLMCATIGGPRAKVWADAHESESSGINTQMDYYNNNVGRSNLTQCVNQYVAMAGRIPTSRDMAEFCIGLNFNGVCRRVSGSNLVRTNGSTFTGRI